MALEDLLGKRKSLEEQIGQFLKGEGTEEEILKSSASARKTREEFLGEIGKTSPEVARFVGAKTGKLETGLEDIARQQLFERKRRNLNLKFNYLFDLARQAGKDVQSAINFARDRMLLEEELKGKGDIAEIERAAARRINELENIYSQREIELLREFQTSPDFLGAFLGGLGGFGGTLAGTFLGRKFPLGKVGGGGGRTAGVGGFGVPEEF